MTIRFSTLLTGLAMILTMSAAYAGAKGGASGGGGGDGIVEVIFDGQDDAVLDCRGKGYFSCGQGTDCSYALDLKDESRRNYELATICNSL